MHRAFSGILAAGLLAVCAPGASAHDNSQVTSACSLQQSFDFVNGGFEYYLYGAAVTPEGGSGTFRCEIRVDGDTVASSVHTDGERVFGSVGPLRGWTSDLDVADLEVCAVVEWHDEHPPYEACGPASDVVGTTFDLVNEEVLKPLDLLTCAVLIALAPGVSGVVDIDPTGDTSVAGTPFWDCPPYAS